MHQQHEGDELLAEIRRYVAEEVPEPLQDVITGLVGRLVVKIMTTPDFYLRLTYVQALTQEVAQLRFLVASQTPPSVRVRAATPRKAPRTPPAPKKRAPAPRKSPQPRSRNGQFKKGSSGR